MSRSKDHHKYPLVFLNVLDKMKETNDAIVLKFPTVAKAKSFRLDFYSFVSAAARDGDLMRYDQYGQFLQVIQVQVRDDPPRAILLKKDYAEMALQVGAALKEWEEEREQKNDAQA